MKKVIVVCVFVIAAAWVGYYINFGIGGVLSRHTDVWGQFGDYVGGVVNPILSFITIYLLIHSIGLQRESNDSLISEIQRQEKLEEYKKFELRFFHLIESQENMFGRFKVVLSENDSTTVELNGGAAVTYFEDSIVVLVDAKTKKKLITDWFEQIDVDDCLFSVVRRFYLIVKLIDRSNHNKDEYYEMLINLTDIKIISLVAFACAYYEWDIVKYINKSKILERDGIDQFVKRISVSS